MSIEWKFEVTSVGDPKIVDGSIEITVQVDAHRSVPSRDGELLLMFGKQEAADLAARLTALSQHPQLKY